MIQFRDFILPLETILCQETVGLGDPDASQSTSTGPGLVAIVSFGCTFQVGGAAVSQNNG